MREKLSNYAPKDVLDFWFSTKNYPKHFAKDELFDKEIKLKFYETYTHAIDGLMHCWEKSVEGILAMIIVLDQFPRNMFRSNPQSYATDHIALSLAKYAIAKEMHISLSNDYKQFLYMPLMHSENFADQKLCFDLFSYNPQAQEYARKHMEIIERFGRFPHRNAILGRISTDEEIDFLKLPNSSF